MITITKCVIGYYEPYYSNANKQKDKILTDLFDNLRILVSFSHTLDAIVLGKYIEKADVTSMSETIIEILNKLEDSKERVKEMIKLLEYWKSHIAIKNLQLPYMEYLGTILAEYYKLKDRYEKEINVLNNIKRSLRPGELSGTSYFEMSTLVRDYNYIIYELLLIDVALLTKVRLLFIKKDFCSRIRR